MNTEQRHAAAIIRAADELRRRIIECTGHPLRHLLELEGHDIEVFDRVALQALQTAQALLRHAILTRAVSNDELNRFLRVLHCLDDRLDSSQPAITGLAAVLCRSLAMLLPRINLPIKAAFVVMLGVVLPQLPNAGRGTGSTIDTLEEWIVLFGIDHAANAIFGLLLTELFVRAVHASLPHSSRSVGANLAAAHGLWATLSFATSSALLQPEFGVMVGSSGSIMAVVLLGVLAIAARAYRRTRTPLVNWHFGPSLNSEFFQ